MSGLFDFVRGFFRIASPETIPADNYAPQQHIFTVETSEGEVCSIDTSDRSSPFYGTAWTKILTASENNDFVRGRATSRCVSRDNRFSGYTVNIDGIEAFLPASKASWFYDPEHDASGKYIALSVENVYTSGTKAGKLVVNAYRPIRFLNSRQGRKNYQPGGTAYAIAMDYDRSFLIFPYQKEQYIYVPLHEAVNFAMSLGLGNNPDMFTGLCWHLSIRSRKDNQCLASPIDILTD